MVSKIVKISNVIPKCMEPDIGVVLKDHDGAVSGI